MTVDGKRTLVGDGVPRPVVTSSAKGSVFNIAASSEITFENLQISGASQLSNGVECTATAGPGSRSVHLVDDLLSQNGFDGIFASVCAVSAVHTTFSDNGGNGAEMSDTTATYDRCTFSGNGRDGISLDGGVYNVTNSFVYRNGIAGIDIFTFPDQPESVFELNTIVDNSSGVSCSASQAALPNNIIVRNTTTSLVARAVAILAQSSYRTCLRFISCVLTPARSIITSRAEAWRSTMQPRPTSTTTSTETRDPRAQGATPASTRHSSYSRRSRQG